MDNCFYEAQAKQFKENCNKTTFLKVPYTASMQVTSNITAFGFYVLSIELA